MKTKTKFGYFDLTKLSYLDTVHLTKKINKLKELEKEYIENNELSDKQIESLETRIKLKEKEIEFILDKTLEEDKRMFVEMLNEAKKK